MSAHPLLQALADRVLIGDGAMGTELFNRGIPLKSCFEEVNVLHPHLVKRIHRDYLEAGADLIETNSFGGNRIRLRRFGLEKRAVEFNRAAARLAREAAGTGAFVAGSVGPITGVTRKEEIDPGEKREAFEEQIRTLAENGCDAILLETFTDLEEILLALGAVRAVCSLPAIAQMTFQEEGRTPLGVSVEEAIPALEQAGADVVGVNCSTGPSWALKAVERITRLTTLPVTVFPNAGIPRYVEGRYIYLATPEYFVEMAGKMIAAGVNLVGGCCGTTPEIIRAIAARYRHARPMPRGSRRRPAAEPKPPRQAAAAAAPSAGRAAFVERLRDRTVIVVEVDPPRTLDLSKPLRAARRLHKAGADAITIGDNPLAILRAGHLGFAHFLEREGIPTIVHLSCRDRNLIGLQSAILEAHYLGVTALLAITGDPARVGDQPAAQSVYDVGSIELLRIIRGMNEGKNHQGAGIGGATRFRIGCAFNPNQTKIEHEIGRLKKKISAGAEFALCQPCYDPAVIERVWGLVAKEAPGFPVFAGLLPPLSASNARFLANEVPGICIPDSVIRRMEAAEPDRQVQEGLAITREIVDAACRFTNGFYLILPFGRADLGAEIVRYVRSRVGREVET